MKRKKLMTMLLAAILLIAMNALPVLAADAAVYSQVDASSQPYKSSPDTYLITSDSVLTWKKYNTVLGYNDMGTQKEKEPAVEVYEKRTGDKTDGILEFSWTFDGSKLKPISESKKGPIGLGITAAPADDGLSVSFATKRAFDGTVTIKLNVNSYFADGDSLTLAYIDGADSSQIHGSDASMEAVTPYQTGDLTVQEGFIEFSVSSGGNFKLINNAKADNSAGESMPSDKAAAGGDAADSLPLEDNTAEITDTVTEKTVEEDTDISEADSTLAEADTEEVPEAEEALAADNEQPAAEPVKEVPKTGSDNNYFAVFGLALFAGAGSIILSGKKALK